MRHLWRACRTSLHKNGSYWQIRNMSRFTKWHETLHFPSISRTQIKPTVFIIGCIPIFTFYLGTWQLRRLKWKLDLIEQLNDQTNREPLELPDVVKCALFTWSKSTLGFELNVLGSFIFSAWMSCPNSNFESL